MLVRYSPMGPSAAKSSRLQFFSKPATDPDRRPKQNQAKGVTLRFPLLGKVGLPPLYQPLRFIKDPAGHWMAYTAR
jgi:hypothetical protein